MTKSGEKNCWAGQKWFSKIHGVSQSSFKADLLDFQKTTRATCKNSSYVLSSWGQNQEKINWWAGQKWFSKSQYSQPIKFQGRPSWLLKKPLDFLKILLFTSFLQEANLMIERKVGKPGKNWIIIAENWADRRLSWELRQPIGQLKWSVADARKGESSKQAERAILGWGSNRQLNIWIFSKIEKLGKLAIFIVNVNLTSFFKELQKMEKNPAKLVRLNVVNVELTSFLKNCKTRKKVAKLVWFWCTLNVVNVDLTSFSR